MSRSSTWTVRETIPSAALIRPDSTAPNPLGHPVGKTKHRVNQSGDGNRQDTPAKVLCLGDLGWREERKCDLRYFFHFPGAEFVHAGLKPPRHALDRCLKLKEAIARFRDGYYDMVVAGMIPHPFPNPRKGLVRRLANMAGASLNP